MSPHLSVCKIRTLKRTHRHAHTHRHNETVKENWIERMV